MFKKIALVLASILLMAGAAFASGPTQYFTDVVDGDWYKNSVDALYQMGVVTGYDDDTYRPENAVNRAELAVMLDRFYTYVKYPSGEEWVAYENDTYSVMYPHAGMDMDGCSTADDLGTDFGFSVSCHSDADTTREELIGAMGDQFGSDRREVRETLEMNGHEALLVRVTTTTHRDWLYQAVFIEDGDALYMLSDAALGINQDFEYFYASFLLN